ncbi:hypothetical protein LSM04_009344 [Trypanosoma melophagium]|uniref:uncharacterized protein n=1 Tax=Trypanosoma melophagium TaxID=715481 RepID=UPI00351A7BBB|nr:hypothetical protein LSM04_009344 [Trypanosoma melophagium]
MGLRASGSSFPSCNRFESQMTLTESQYQACLDQLKKVIDERDMLEEKVQAMEEQRVLGESTIRELIEENKRLRVAVEQVEVRLGITEIEQQSILAEAQQLRGSLNQSLRELERSRQTSTHLELTTNKETPVVHTRNKVLWGGEASLLTSSSQPQEREDEGVATKRLFTTVPNSSVSTPTVAQVTPVAVVKINSPKTSQQTVETKLVNDGIYKDEKNSLLASNKRLEARCYVLESQLQRLRERLLLQNL